MKFDTCANCGHSLKMTSGPGRMKRYRGFILEVPHDLIIPKCVKCAAEWMDCVEVRKLSASFEAQLKAKQRNQH